MVDKETDCCLRLQQIIYKNFGDGCGDMCDCPLEEHQLVLAIEATANVRLG